ncbi:MAG: hypothetical protein ACPGN3_13955 [Opitutales bacterium]
MKHFCERFRSILLVSIFWIPCGYVLGNEVSVTLSAIALDCRLMDVKYETDGEEGALYAFPGQRSETFRYNGAQTLTLYRNLSQLDEFGNPLRKTVAQTQLPATSGQYLLLISEKSNSPEAYEIFTIADDWSDFGVGTYRFLNLASFDVALNIDGDISRIQERGITDVDPRLSDVGHYKAMMVSLPSDDEPLPVFEGFIYFADDRRMLYIISPRPGARAGSIKLAAIPQLIPKAQ